MDLGFKQAGFKIIWANDCYKFACETYKKNFGVDIVRDDIRKIKDFPEADVLVACNPCQGYSMIGKRKANDTRNFLYLEIFRALRQVRPRYFVIENVKGMKWLFKGKFFRLIRDGLARQGYRVYWKIIDTKDYGVPQHRERIIIVGVRKDLKVKYQFPKKTHGPGLRRYVSLRKAIGHLPSPKQTEYHNKDDWSFFYMSRNRRAEWTDVSFTIQANGREVPLHPSSPPMRWVERDHWVFTGPKAKYRRLSAKECARIQTFPPHFKFEGVLESQYVLIGNAVPPKLARVIAESIMRMEWRRLAAIARKKRVAKEKAVRRKVARMVRHKPEELALAQRIRPLQVADRRKAIATNRR